MNQHTIRAECSFSAPADLIRGDGDLLQQAMINFVLNAIDAMPSGGTITVSTAIVPPPPSVENTAIAAAADCFMLSFSDTGIGIATEDQHHIFDPFYSTKPTGTGLGLSVSHGIIAEHGGIIRVESELKHGTTFRIYFPRLLPEAAA